MKPMTTFEGLELELQIEELELKIAPDGETVLPLGPVIGPIFDYVRPK